MLVPPDARRDGSGHVLRQRLSERASVHLQRSKYVRSDVIFEPPSGNVFDDGTDQAVAVVRVELHFIRRIHAVRQDVPHYRLHGWLFANSKTVTDETIVESRPVL